MTGFTQGGGVAMGTMIGNGIGQDQTERLNMNDEEQFMN